MNIQGEKIRLVRLALGWPQRDLADQLGIHQPHLSEMEAGARSVPEHVATSLQFLTGFSFNYFTQPIRADVPLMSKLLFRRPKNKWRKSDGDQAYCQLVFDAFEPLTQKLAPRDLLFPRGLRLGPKQAAAYLRSVLVVRPDGRIENPVYLAERAGVRVVGVHGTRLNPERQPHVKISEYEHVEMFHAFSFWSNGLPVVFLRTDINPDLMNWALVHDLFHLLMHSNYTGDLKNAEMEAQEATEEFFLPEEPFKMGFAAGRASLDRIMNLALHWNVSPMSIILRADKLGFMPSKGYFLKCIRDQKFAIQHTKPRFYRQMCEVLFGTPVVPRTAIAIGMPKAFVRNIMIAHSGDAAKLD
ncbi:MAG: ImmA/IrrE family metallo-endopeptidase [Armatimonadetes bacterium]|nr:ImmA/IrrE family metallo-endopeptidase [Armatimonadota bacterium]